MTEKRPSEIDHLDSAKLLSNPPVLASFQSCWKNIHLAHFRQPLIYLPEVATLQHIIIIPLGHKAVDLEFILDGRKQKTSYQEKDYSSGFIEVFPASLPYGLSSNSTAVMEWIQFYLEPKFLAQVAHECVKLEHVDLALIQKKLMS
jgi:AraC family transcriptional regulator